MNSNSSIFKRSHSRLLPDVTGSPYLDQLARPCLKKVAKHKNHNTSLVSKKALSDILAVSSTSSVLKRTQTYDFKRSSSVSKMTPTKLELLFNERLHKLHIGDSEYASELEVADSIFSEFVNHFMQFSNVLTLVREKIEEGLKVKYSEGLEKNVAKLKKQNLSLINKLNALSKINLDLVEENEKLKRIQENYGRLLGDNPDFLINYHNIVEQMLKQCETITSLKAEVKRLKAIIKKSHDSMKADEEINHKIDQDKGRLLE